MNKENDLKKISILCPTRGRPDNMSKLVRSALDTASDKLNIEVVFYIDNDDQPSIERALSLANYHNGLVKYIIGPRIILSETWNECYNYAAGDIFNHSGDDNEFKTQSWDEKVREAFRSRRDRIVFAFGSDGNENKGANANFGTHGFIHKNHVKALGYLFPNLFSSDYNDTYLNYIYEEIGRRVKIDILIDHYHPAFGRGVWDQTHKERLERHKRDNCGKIYEDSLSLRLKDIKRLKNFIEEYNV